MHQGKADGRGPRAGAGDLPAPVACRVSAACLASAGPVQAPVIGGDAPAAVLLASHDRGACPLSCIRSRCRRVPAMCRSPAIRARPSPGTTRGSRHTAEAARPSGRPRRHLYSRRSPAQGCSTARPRLSQRGFQVSVADRQGHPFHCFHWPAGSRRRDGIGHLRTSVRVLAASRRPGRARRSAAALAAQPAQGGTGWHRGKHHGIGVRNCPPAAGTAPWSRPLGARRLGRAAAQRVPANGARRVVSPRRGQ